MNAMGWQKHTTRAVMSAGGSLAKRGLLTSSGKVGDKRKVQSLNYDCRSVLPVAGI
jgi:hypothetical protein